MNFSVLRLSLPSVFGLVALAAFVSAGCSRGESRKTSAPKAWLVCEKPSANLGEVFEGAAPAREFLLENRSDAPVSVSEIEIDKTCECTETSFDSDPLQPGSVARLRVVIDTRGKAGDLHTRITLRDKDGQLRPLELALQVTVRPTLSVSTDRVDFGVIAGNQIRERTFEVRQRVHGAPELVGVEPKNAALTAQFDRIEDGDANALQAWRVVLRLNPARLTGPAEGVMELTGSDSNAPKLSVAWTAQPTGGYEIIPDEVAVVIMPHSVSSSALGQVLIRRRDGRSFRVVESYSDLEFVEMKTAAHAASPECRMVISRRKATQNDAPEFGRGTILLETDDQDDAPLMIPVSFYAPSAAGGQMEITEQDPHRLEKMLPFLATGYSASRRMVHDVYGEGSETAHIVGLRVPGGRTNAFKYTTLTWRQRLELTRQDVAVYKSSDPFEPSEIASRRPTSRTTSIRGRDALYSWYPTHGICSIEEPASWDTGVYGLNFFLALQGGANFHDVATFCAHLAKMVPELDKTVGPRVFVRPTLSDHGAIVEVQWRSNDIESDCLEDYRLSVDIGRSFLPVRLRAEQAKEKTRSVAERSLELQSFDDGRVWFPRQANLVEQHFRGQDPNPVQSLKQSLQFTALHVNENRDQCRDEAFTFEGLELPHGTEVRDQRAGKLKTYSYGGVPLNEAKLRRFLEVPPQAEDYAPVLGNPEPFRVNGADGHYLGKRSLCGPLALWCVAHDLGSKPTLSRIVELTKPGDRGVSLEQLRIAAVQLGLGARSLHISDPVKLGAALENVPGARAIVYAHHSHYWAITEFEDGRFRVADFPSVRRLTPTELGANWSGECIVVAASDEELLALGDSRWHTWLGLAIGIACCVVAACGRFWKRAEHETGSKADLAKVAKV